MTMVIGILMVIVAAAYVALPFFSAAPAVPFTGPRPVTNAERQKFERQKIEAYAAIKELEFDYRMGKLSDADFAGIRDKYAAQAVEAIAALEAAKAAQPRNPTEGRRQSRIAFCPTCGVSVPSRANFCPACGRSLKQEAVA